MRVRPLIRAESGNKEYEHADAHIGYDNVTPDLQIEIKRR